MFGELVVGYLFLGGAGAGGCAVTSALGLLVGASDMRALGSGDAAGRRGAQFRRFFSAAWGASVGCLAAGMLCLALDLGRLDRLALVIFASPTNLLVVGAWALGLCALLGLLSLAWWNGLLAGLGRGGACGVGRAAARGRLRSGAPRAGAARAAGARALQVATLVVALVAAAYTGLLLAGMAAVSLWHSGWLPVLFLLSALSCGAAAVMLAALVAGMVDPFRRTMALLVRADRVILLLESVVLVAWLASVWAGAGGAAALDQPAHGTAAAALASVMAVLEGAQAVPFWCGLVGAGLVGPLVAETVWLRGTRSTVSPQRSLECAAAALTSSAGVLVGGFMLRAVVVGAATAPLVGVGF